MRTILPLLTILTLALTVAPRAAAADGPTLELKSGTMFAGGVVGYSRDDSSREMEGYTIDDVSSGLVFSPTVGYFVTPTLALTGSVTVGITSRELKRTDQDGYWSRQELEDEPLGFSVGLRFLIPTGGRLCAYVGGEVAYTRIASEYRDDSSEGNADYDYNANSEFYGVNVIGGLLYSLTNHVAIDIGLKFTYQKGELEFEGVDEPKSKLENNGVSFGYLGLMAFF